MHNVECKFACLYDLAYHTFLGFHFPVFSLVQRAPKYVFQCISKQLEVCQKRSSSRGVFNSFLGAWKGDETSSVLFDIASNTTKFILPSRGNITLSSVLHFSFKSGFP